MIMMKKLSEITSKKKKGRGIEIIKDMMQKMKKKIITWTISV